MVLSFLKWGLISLTIIYLIHHLYMFFLNILTIPQIKDLVNKPTEQYDELFKTITTNTKDNSNTGSVDNMTEELSSFLKDLKKTSSNSNSNNNTSNNNNSNNNFNYNSSLTNIDEQQNLFTSSQDNNISYSNY